MEEIILRELMSFRDKSQTNDYVIRGDKYFLEYLAKKIKVEISIANSLSKLEKLRK